MDGGLDAIWVALQDAGDAIIGSQAVLACLALGLACVFALSGIPKIRKPELAALAIVDFGLMSHSRRWAGLSIGIGECGLALALAVSAASASTAVRVLPALAAALLLWTFVALIARALRSNEEFACYCFGSGEATLSGATLARTGLLALAASALAAGGFSQAAQPTAEEWASALVVSAAAVGSVVLLAKVPAILRVSA
jgi:hypothetical protein